MAGPQSKISVIFSLVRKTWSPTDGSILIGQKDSVHLKPTTFSVYKLPICIIKRPRQVLVRPGRHMFLHQKAVCHRLPQIHRKLSANTESVQRPYMIFVASKTGWIDPWAREVCFLRKGKTTLNMYSTRTIQRQKGYNRRYRRPYHIDGE